MQCPKCKSVVWFGDKCAGCGTSRAKAEPEKEDTPKRSTPPTSPRSA